MRATTAPPRYVFSIAQNDILATMKNIFSIQEALHFGWRTTRAHSAVLFQILLTLFAVEIAYSIVQEVLGKTLEGILAMIALSILGDGARRGAHASHA